MPKLLLIALLLICARKGVAQDTTLPLRTTVVLSPPRPAFHPPASAGLAGKSSATPTPPPKDALITKPAIITTPALIRIYNPSAVATSSSSAASASSASSASSQTTYKAGATLAMNWELQVDGMIRQKGRIGNLMIGPRQEKLVHLPLRIPNGEEGEIFLQVCYRLQPPGMPIPDGPILTQDQILLRAATGKNLVIAPAGELSFADENDTFSIRSSTIHLAFNKQTGWLQHYEINGTDLLEDTLGLKSNFWLPAQGRESLASDSRPKAAGGDSSSRPSDSAKAWLEATRDPHLQLFSTSTGSELVIVRTEYTLPATSCLLHLSYTINAAGEMLVSQQLEPDTAQAGYPLPCFGMKWALPTGYDSITYYGKNPDTTSWIAIYRKKLIQASAPDIHPRGTVAGTAIRWWKITGQDGRGLLITADSSFLDLSALPPAQAQPLHQSQTQLSIDYPHFDMPYANYRYAFKVSPVMTGHP